jgi:phosphoglycerate dehydrogenase-like enzyme
MQIAPTDVVVLATPSAKETTHLRRGALEVDAARGPAGDPVALVQAVYTGKIRAVFPATDAKRVVEGPQILLIPHAAGAGAHAFVVKAGC